MIGVHVLEIENARRSDVVLGEGGESGVCVKGFAIADLNRLSHKMESWSIMCQEI